MLRSVLLVVDAQCIGRVIRRAAQLPLAHDAVLTIVESYKHPAYARLPLELHGLALLARRRRIRCTSVGPLDGAALLQLARACSAELVIVGDAGLFCWRVGRLLGRAPVLLVRASSVECYRRPLVAIDPRGGAPEVLHFTREVLPTTCPVMTAVHAHTGAAEYARRWVASLLSSFGSFGAGWTRYLGHGDARTVISNAANQARADLVIVGSRPRSAIARLLFGSVIGSVLRDVSCDVLAVPVTTAPSVLALPRAISGAR